MILSRVHRKMRRNNYLFYFILFLSIIPDSHSQLNQKCSQAFLCGGIPDIRYPFWGSNRPEICGFPGFELDCEGDVPFINIGFMTYRVLEINYELQSLRVARQDLWNNTCPFAPQNTTLDPRLFQSPSVDSHLNVTLYYDCTNDLNPVINFDHQFRCDVYGDEDGFNDVNLLGPGMESERGANIACKAHILVPVHLSAAQDLSAPASINDLRDAIASGFWVRWHEKITNCESCVESDGICGYDPGSSSITCNYTPKVYPKQVLALVESPGPSPSPFYYTDTRDDGKSGLPTWEKVLIGMVIAVTVIVSVAFIIVYLRRRRPKRLQSGLKRETNPNVENFLLNNESMAPRRYKYSQIKKITKSFSDKLGQGGYGSVYKGTLPDGQFVAVKLLTETKSNGEDFVNEVASISRTSHVNIVNLLGFCYEKNRRALVYEYMPNQSLDKFISTGRSVDTNNQLDWETLFKIAVGVARGLEYLHKGCNTRIIHFDIKPQNILLDEEFCPKISDFGLAKLCKKKQSVVSIAGTRGTVGYIAPEVFSRNFGGVSHKSDVYSYGMMVLEMAGARNIAGARSTRSSENYFPDKIYEQVILQENKNLDHDMVSEDVDEATRKMFLVGFWCIQTVPSDRPSMSRVVEMLEGSLQSIQTPPKPYLFNPPKLGQGFSSSSSGNIEIEISIRV